MTSWRFWISPGAIPVWLALAVASWAAWNAWANRELAAEIARLTAAGEPIRAAQAAPPPVAEEDNAAPIFARALALVSEPADSSETSRFVEDWSLEPSAEARRGIESWVRGNVHALRLLRDGARLPASRWPMDWSRGVSMPFPGLLSARLSAVLLSAQARLEAEAGRFEESEALLVAAFRLGRSFEGEPMLVMVMIGSALESIAFRATEGWLSLSNAGGEALLEDARASAARDASGRILGACFSAERASIFDLVLANPGEVLAQELRVPEFAAIAVGPYFKYDLVRYSRLSQILIDVGSGRRADDAAAAAEYDALLRHAGPLTSVTVPNLRRSRETLDETMSRRRLLLVALAGFRAARNGAWPSTWPELEASVDPFTGRPFRIAVRDSELLLYGVGSDRGDNGGHASRDIPLRIRRKP